MKKIKLMISLLALSMVFAACDQTTSTKETVKEETKLETVNEKEIKDTEEENSKEETKSEANETTAEPVSAAESQAETKDEETKEKQIIEIKEDNTGENKTVATIDVTPSDKAEFNTAMTKELQSAVAAKSASLVYGYDVTYDLYPADKLQAIAKFKDNISSGYVVRYGVNKIGLAVRYNEAPENIGYTIHDGALQMNQTEEVIKSDLPEEYKALVQNLVSALGQGEAKIDFAY